MTTFRVFPFFLMQGRLLSVFVWVSCWLHHVFFNFWKGQWVWLGCNKWWQGSIPALWKCLFMLQEYSLGSYSRESCKLFQFMYYINTYVCKKNFKRFVCMYIYMHIPTYICICIICVSTSIVYNYLSIFTLCVCICHSFIHSWLFPPVGLGFHLQWSAQLIIPCVQLFRVKRLKHSTALFLKSPSLINWYIGIGSIGCLYPYVRHQLCHWFERWLLEVPERSDFSSSNIVTSWTRSFAANLPPWIWVKGLVSVISGLQDNSLTFSTKTLLQRGASVTGASSL